MKRPSLIDTLYQFVDEIISEMPLKERVSLANMKREDVETLQSVFDLYIRDRIKSEDMDRIRETHLLRVVK